MTPSEILNAAADRIRDLAAAADPGPWTNLEGTTGFWTMPSPERSRRHLRGYIGMAEAKETARWIALMSPAVAPHLEQALRNEAEQYHQLTVAGLVDDPQHAPDPSLLDLARAVLGEGSHD